MATGGVAAAFGFLYQYLVTVELCLDLYESSSTDWCVAVDLQDQDSADILIYDRPGASPRRVVQVKASLPGSTNSLGGPEAKRLLAAMATEHPGASERMVVTNRRLALPATELPAELRRSRQKGAAIREEIDARNEGVREITARLVDRIARLRQRGGLGSGLHHLLLASLRDMVFECGSRTSSQMVTRSMVAAILDEPTATLADAAGRRGWGLTYGAPVTNAVERPGIFRFLSDALSDEALRSGVPPRAVLAGSPGAGKSVAAGLWSAERREHYALTIWLDATSSLQLAEQAPSLMRWLEGGDGEGRATERDSGADSGPPPVESAAKQQAPEDLAQSFQDALAALPVPWLLVLDGAVDHAELDAWVPKSGYGHIVITTNRGDWPRDLAPQKVVGEMPDAEVTALIRRRLAGPGETFEDPIDPVAVDFARRLGRWPLAIDLACAWVRGLDGDLEHLPDFVARLDRFDLTGDDGAGLGGYPRAVGVLVSELWNALSEQARSVLALVVFSGGFAIPAQLIEEWAREVAARFSLTIDAGSAVRELVGASLLTRRLRSDAREVSRYDEILNTHDGIRLALVGAGLGMHPALAYVWLEVCAQTLVDVLGEGRIDDAEALISPISSFIETLLTSTRGDLLPRSTSGDQDQVSGEADRARRELLDGAATVMHNLGSLDLLTGHFDRAAAWLVEAVQVREELNTDTGDCSAVFAVAQIETLALLIQAESGRRAYEEIRPLVERVLVYSRDPQIFETDGSGQPVAATLRSIAEISCLASEDCADLRDQITQLVGERVVDSASTNLLERRVQAFTEATARASALAEEEQWSRAVDAVLAAVEPSVRDGALLHQSVEAVLDIASAMIMSMLLRSPSTLPGSWEPAFRRLFEWCSSVEIVAEEQRIRASFLGPIADANTDELGHVVERARDRASGDEQLEGWVTIAELATEWLAPPVSILPMQFKPPPGMVVFRPVGLSDAILRRPVLWEGEPGLVVHAPGLLVQTDSREIDAAFHALGERGFPDGPDQNGETQVAVGWAFRGGEHGGYELTDPQGQVVLALEPADGPSRGAWDQTLHEIGMVRIIFTDPADLEPAEAFAVPEQALVRVVSVGAEPLRPQGVRREERVSSLRRGLLGGLWNRLKVAFTRE